MNTPLRFLLLFLISFGVSTSLGEKENTARPCAEFAGIWFYSAIKQNTTKKQFPIGYVYGPSTSKEVGKDNISNLHKAMHAGLLKERKKDGRRILDYMPEDPEADFSNSVTSDSVVFACALNYEHVESQYEAGTGSAYSKILAEIGFDLVICNFKDRRILATIPGRVVAIDAVPGRASQSKKNALLHHLYEKKLIPEFIKLCKAPYSSLMATKTLGIDKIRVDKGALEKIPTNYKAAGERSYMAYLSSLVSSSFYSAVKVPILPWSGGGDKIFYVMSERIKDTGRVMDEALKDKVAHEKESGNPEPTGKDFLLKKPDYTLEVVFPGFLTHTMQSNKFQKQLAFVAFCGLRLKQGDREIIMIKFKDAVSSTYPTDIKLESSWINYEDATIKMLRSAAITLKKRKKTNPIIQQTSVN